MIISAEVRWPGPDSAQRVGIRGSVVISQEKPDCPAYYQVNLKGLKPNSYHGFHIHDKPITSAKDLNKTCQSCGGHFNPTGKQHGSVLNDLPQERHAGDLINNLRADSTGTVKVSFYDDMAILIPTNKTPYTVMGKSIVIHEDRDDLGRQGVSPVLPYVDSKNIRYDGSPEDDVHFYQDEKKRDESLVTGNAGARLACGNIVPTCPPEVLDLYINND